MTVCILVTKGNLGGAQRYVESLARALASRKLDTIVGAGEGDQLLPRLEASGIKTVRFNGLGNSSVWADLRLVCWLGVRYLRREVDTFVFNSTKLLPIAWLLSFLLPHSAVVFVCHGFPFIPGSRSAWARFKAALLFWMVGRIRNVVCVSSYVLSLIAERVSNRSNLILARNTLEPFVARELASAAMGGGGVHRFPNRRLLGRSLPVVPVVGAGPLRAVSLAELNANKGVDALCDALGPHRDVLVGRFEWHIFGDGRDRAFVESRIAANRLNGIVVLHGFRDDARSLLPDFDVLLIPSRNEAFGLVALEAAASGVFVFGAHVGGIPEAIPSDEHGCTFKRLDEMAEAISRMASGRLRPLPPPILGSEYWERRHGEWLQIHFELICPESYENWAR